MKAFKAVHERYFLPSGVTLSFGVPLVVSLWCFTSDTWKKETPGRVGAMVLHAFRTGLIQISELSKLDSESIQNYTKTMTIQKPTESVGLVCCATICDIKETTRVDEKRAKVTVVSSNHRQIGSPRNQGQTRNLSLDIDKASYNEQEETLCLQNVFVVVRQCTYKGSDHFRLSLRDGDKTRVLGALSQENGQKPHSCSFPEGIESY
eukprot:scaffold4589_cov132-Cylindrotheca_fusiformis.AAC.3